MNMVYTKKLPSTLPELFNINILQSDELKIFLIKNNVYRIELDNLVWEMKPSSTKKVKVSLYYPYILLTLTRYCGALNSEFERVCNKNCNKKTKFLKSEDVFFVKGNALYYKNAVMPEIKSLEKNNIDRIVYQDF